VTSEGELTTLDYSLKDCEVIFNCDQTKRRAILGDLAKRLRDQVQASGAKLTGALDTPDYSQTGIPFETDRTAGQIIFYSTELDDKRVKLNFIAFECRRR
jgi:hypothetical protein